MTTETWSAIAALMAVNILLWGTAAVRLRWISRHAATKSQKKNGI